MLVYTNLSFKYRFWVSFLIGIICGIIGIIIGFGWNTMFPITINDLDSIFNFNQEFTKMNFIEYNGREWNIIITVGYIFSSFTLAFIYVMVSEFWLKIKIYYGICYGILLWFIFFIITFPILGTIPSLMNEPKIYFIALIGHIIWSCIIEFSRRDLRNRITGERDPH